MTTGIVLFAHGSRDPGWAMPIERIARNVTARRPDVRVVTSYLEHMSPTLDEALASLAAEGVTELVVAPLFLAPGGHIKRDLPPKIAALQARHPSVTVRMLPTLGEADALLESIAAWIARELA